MITVKIGIKKCRSLVDFSASNKNFVQIDLLHFSNELGISSSWMDHNRREKEKQCNGVAPCEDVDFIEFFQKALLEKYRKRA